MAAHSYLENRMLVMKARRKAGEGYRDMAQVARGQTRVVSDDASLVSSNGASLTTAAYEIDETTGDVLIGGTLGTLAALDDQDLLADLDAFNLDGSAPAAIDAGKSVIVARCAVLVNDVPARAYVFGDAADTGEEAEPTPTQCREAIEKGGLANHKASGLGIVLGTITIKRVDQATLTYSGTPDIDPGDVATIDYNGVEVVNYTILSATLNDEVAAIRALLDTALAAEPVTVGGSNAVITITADDDATLDAVAADVTVGDGGDMAVAVTATDPVTMVHSDPAASDAIKQGRLAGVLAA